jgi:hypothetical protein
MRDLDIARWRLRSQHVVWPYAVLAREAAGALLAVQAENPGQAAWAVASRTRDPDQAELAALLDDGTVLRTHVLRPTWHFVRAEDVGWLLELTGPPGAAGHRPAVAQRPRPRRGCHRPRGRRRHAGGGGPGRAHPRAAGRRAARTRHHRQRADADDPAGPRRTGRADLQRNNRRRRAHLRGHERARADTTPAGAGRGLGRARPALFHRAWPGDRTGPRLLGHAHPHRRARRAGPGA